MGYSWSASAILMNSQGEFGPSSVDRSPSGLNARTCNYDVKKMSQIKGLLCLMILLEMSLVLLQHRE
jgi:hypothetical protein